MELKITELIVPLFADFLPRTTDNGSKTSARSIKQADWKPVAACRTIRLLRSPITPHRKKG
ncbi:hypothetical protein [Paenibacillus oceani]|uniref:Uncharacterized protein n=1 Tax=Paenibacillus oceani TaxID=2772510 RepID=A0A927C8Y0_9BACL|nr:hypothetical protein [Paenibacillus oceani]MBD2862192.1 hypothetical protein [Paenibacillus oceani]